MSSIDSKGKNAEENSSLNIEYTSKTGLDEEAKKLVRFELIKLVKSDVAKLKEQNQKLNDRLDFFRSLPKTAVFLNDLEDPLMTLKVAELELKEIEIEVFDQKSLEAINIDELTLLKKRLKFIKYSQLLISKNLDYVNQAHKAMLKKPINIFIGVVCITLGILFYIFLR